MSTDVVGIDLRGAEEAMRVIGTRVRTEYRDATKAALRYLHSFEWRGAYANHFRKEMTIELNKIGYEIDERLSARLGELFHHIQQQEELSNRGRL